MINGTSLFVVDGFAIRQVNITTGDTTTFAGNATTSGTTDGVGTAARFSSIKGLSTDGTNLYVSDRNIVRMVNLSTGAVSTYIGPSGVINLAASAMPTVQGLFFGEQGLFFTNLYSGIFLAN